MLVKQGWKLQTVRLSGTGKNGAGQVKKFGTFPKERLKLWNILSAYLSRTCKNSAVRVDLFDTFPKERLNYFVISTPVKCMITQTVVRMFLQCISPSTGYMYTFVCKNKSTIYMWSLYERADHFCFTYSNILLFADIAWQ